MGAGKITPDKDSGSASRYDAVEGGVGWSSTTGSSANPSGELNFEPCYIYIPRPFFVLSLSA